MPKAQAKELPEPTVVPTVKPTIKPTAKPSPTATASAGLQNTEKIEVKVNEPKDNIRKIAYDATVAKWGESQWYAMEKIINKESGFNPYAMNKFSGACGLPQSLPCSKLLNKCGSLDNVSCQVSWMIDYVQNRYGTPQNALAFHANNNWY